MENTRLSIASGAVTDRGLSEKRPENEDSFLELPASGIFAVADGVGGAQAGEVASQMAVEIVEEAFKNFKEGSDAEDVMRAAFEQANTAIFQMAQDLPQLSQMATTIVALHIAGNIATIGHVGDSRVYRVDQGGELHRETADHSVVAEEVRAGRMTEEQAETHPSRNIISRAIGAEGTVEPDLRTILIEPGSAFLLCSDGITRHVSDSEIKGVLNFGGAPTEICDYLKRTCYERGAEDNLTAVVVKIAGDAGSAATSRTTSEILIGLDEAPTIATARGTFVTEDEADELLEIDTKPLVTPAHVERPIVPALESSSSEPHVGIEDDEVDDQIATVEPTHAGPNDDRELAMFGETASDRSLTVEDAATSSKIIPAIAMLLLGTAIGLGVYHFALRPAPTTDNAPPLTEMRSGNIPLSAFEENRRNVDADPAAWVQRVGPLAEDSEDFYLLGRALLLTGNYDQAKAAFIEARSRLPQADQANAKVLASDIAVGLAVTHDTTIRSILETELRSRPLAPSNANR